MKKILWISPYAPYDTVAHGGGKTHNFYIKYFHKKQYDITLLSMCPKEEESKLDLDEYGIKNNVFVMDKTSLAKWTRLLISGLAIRNPFDKYGGICLPYERRQMLRQIREYYQIGEVPDIIMLQWTFSLMFLEELKALFPNSKMIAIEEDVTFLNHERRKKDNNNTKWQQFFWRQRFRRTKTKELECLGKTDLIITNNKKDTRLLLDNGIEKEKIFTSTPYIEDYLHFTYNSDSKDIVFYGAMSRRENYLSAIWFLEKVFPYIDDKETRFIIVGANPHESLLKYACNRVVITGFIDDAGSILAKCRCLVAPLVGGAGIKIKILEAMSVGVPVLTNGIGIEGIGANEGREYLHCESAEDYINAIHAVLADTLDIKTISENAKRHIINNFNLSVRLDQLMNLID